MKKDKNNPEKKIIEINSSQRSLPIDDFDKNINISTVNYGKLSKEQIIALAYNYHSKGKVSEANKYYNYFFERGFTDPKVLRNYAILLKDNGNIEGAEMILYKSIEIKPEFFDAYLLLSSILFSQKKYDEAVSLLIKLIDIKPDLYKPYLILAVHFKSLGDFDKTELYLEKLILIKPEIIDSYIILASIYISQNKFNIAEKSLRRGIKYQPNSSKLYNQLGILLKDIGKIEEAKITMQKAIELNPDSYHSYLILGGILKILGNLTQAEISTRKAIELKPDYAPAYKNLGQILNGKGDLLNASKSYIKAFQLSPDNLSKVGVYTTLSNLFEFSLINKYLPDLNLAGLEGEPIDPFRLITIEDDPERHLKRAVNFYNNKFKNSINNINYRYKNKINIGYFSADFHNHPVMKMMAGVFDLHNREKFNIFAYSFGRKHDKYTDRLKDNVFCFRDILMLNNLEILKLVRNDNIDIAVDLMGYTFGNKMNIFASRVAPIQVNYLGYPGSSGSSEIDYLIGDNVITPYEHAKYYSEKIVHMPNCYMPFDDKRVLPKNNFVRKDFGLPENAFVMAAFHRPHKITIKEAESWSRILLKISHSVVWLSSSNEIAENNLINFFKDKGISQERIIFAKWLSSADDHLARHLCADLFIDTFNFNAHSTAIDSLWIGLPVVTLIGKSIASRASASYLTVLDLPELIAENINEYENIVLDLSEKPEKLDNIKNHLKKIRSNNLLFNSQQMTKDLEKIYSEMLEKINN